MMLGRLSLTASLAILFPRIDSQPHESTVDFTRHISDSHFGADLEPYPNNELLRAAPRLFGCHAPPCQHDDAIHTETGIRTDVEETVGPDGTINDPIRSVADGHDGEAPVRGFRELEASFYDAIPAPLLIDAPVRLRTLAVACEAPPCPYYEAVHVGTGAWTAVEVILGPDGAPFDLMLFTLEGHDGGVGTVTLVGHVLDIDRAATPDPDDRQRVFHSTELPVPVTSPP